MIHDVTQATAVLLAAGGGTRFVGAEHKLTAVIGGRTVVNWSLQNLISARFKHLIVVTGAVNFTPSVAQLDLSSVTFVNNPEWSSGMASSLQCGIKVANNFDADAVVVGLADQPALGSDSWIRVGSSTAKLAVATYQGKRGNPVRISRELWPMLPIAGDIGARAIFESHQHLIEEVPCLGSTLDLDTVDDLEKLRQILESE